MTFSKEISLNDTERPTFGTELKILIPCRRRSAAESEWPWEIMGDSPKYAYSLTATQRT